MGAISNFLGRKVVLLFAFLLLICPKINYAQINLEIIPLDKDTFFIKENIIYQTQFADTFSLERQLTAIRLQLVGEGYLEASFDQILWEDSVAQAHLICGEIYQWASLKNGNVEAAFLEKTGFRERLFKEKTFSYEQVREVQEDLLNYAENNGYPFAKVWLDSLSFMDQSLEAQLFMQRGKLITFKGVNIEGEANISEKYLENYLGIREGELYDKRKILRVRDRIRELPFVKQKRNAVISFEDNQAVVNLFLEKKKASRFDFIIGILPGDRMIENGVEVQRVLVTGELNAELYNQFGKGERIFAEFERLRPETQELTLEFSYPYILDLPFGADATFNSYRRDSSYNDVRLNGGVRYLFEGGNYLKAFWDKAFTNLQIIDNQQIINTKTLPNNLDIDNTSFGLEYQFQRLDYRLNPRKGWHLFARGSAGVKTILENDEISELEDPNNPNFDFSTLYDSLELRTFQYRLEAEIARYFPLFKTSTIKTSIRAGYVLSPQQNIYQNEQFRLGGNRLLRGFNEETIFATNFAIGTLEYRLLIAQNSYFYLFGDYAYVEDITANTRRYDQPFGFGGGMSFETGAGIFTVGLAVGRERANPIDFRNPKVHFGYVNYF